MTPYDEIMSALELYSRAEKTELAYRLISGKIGDPDLIIEELGLAEELNRREEIAEREVGEEFSPDVLLEDIPTKKLAEYVNDVMKEMQ